MGRKPKNQVIAEISKTEDGSHKLKMNPVELPANSEEYRIRLRALVNNFYDMQKLRIQMGNRLVASLAGLAEEAHKREQRDSKILSMSEDERAEVMPVEKEDDKIDIKAIHGIMDEYQRIADYFKDSMLKKSPSVASIEKIISSMSEDNLLTYVKSYCDYKMAQNYSEMLKAEENALKPIEDQVKRHPMWDAFFKDVKGCGVTMAAICLAYFDPDKARHASSFWKYCGLDVVADKDGNPAGHDKKFTVEVEYINKEGKVATKKSLGYNPFLKSKIVEVLGGSIIKQCVHVENKGKKNETRTYEGYALAYRDYLNRLDNHEVKKDYAKYHKHRMAMRYMVKQFIRDMWYVWRDLCGYELEDPYEVAFLGRKHHGYNEAVDTRLDAKVRNIPVELKLKAKEINNMVEI